MTFLMNEPQAWRITLGAEAPASAPSRRALLGAFAAAPFAIGTVAAGIPERAATGKFDAAYAVWRKCNADHLVAIDYTDTFLGDPNSDDAATDEAWAKQDIACTADHDALKALLMVPSLNLLEVLRKMEIAQQEELEITMLGGVMSDLRRLGRS